jgi:DNA-binding XRE family transcriptional regulator
MSNTDIDRIGEIVGWNLRCLMHRDGVSQERLARAIGVSYKTIQRIRDGLGAGSRLWIMVDIADFFGVSVNELYKEEMIYE